MTKSLAGGGGGNAGGRGDPRGGNEAGGADAGAATEARSTHGPAAGSDAPGAAEPLVPGARFGHVNVIARDWRSLADFYTRLFGCRFVPPERDYTGPDLEAGTGVAGAALRGAHLRLPGLADDGPTLEIYQYASMPDGLPALANRPGFQHIAFAVPSVAQAREAVLATGGGPVGSVVTLETADGRFVTWAYVTDPEGNIVELQSWSDSRP